MFSRVLLRSGVYMDVYRMRKKKKENWKDLHMKVFVVSYALWNYDFFLMEILTFFA